MLTKNKFGGGGGMKRLQLLPYLIGLMLVLVGIVLVYMHPTDVRPSKNPESNTEVAGFFETLGPSNLRLQEPHKLITNIAGRSVTSLNGKWNIRR